MGENSVRTMSFAGAIDDALAYEMERDKRIIIWGEDVELNRVNLFSRFGPKRVRNTPISESTFLGAGVTAAMSGLKPVVEIMFVDFIGVALDAILNHAAKNKFFSGGKWNVPLVIRAACGGGYGDGGQHEQSLWGWLAHIPGISVVVPSTPADGGGLMLSAIEHDEPVIFLEHKLLADYWLDYMGGSSRNTVEFDLPTDGINGEVPDKWEPIPLGKADIRLQGKDLTIVSLGVGIHRSLEAAESLKDKGISVEVIDLRSVFPIDKELVCSSIEKTKNLLVVDEDYQNFGLSGELAAIGLEWGKSFKYARVCTKDTIPYARNLEDLAFPNTKRIVEEAIKLCKA
jgi:pyruvate dehydrogenase E1 component beta subunit